ncbi:hypothetical protein ACWGB8_03750 [Kitasatospora sp. NPDC054939]
MIRRTVRAAIAATAGTAMLTTGLVACGTVEQLSAADRVSKAFEKLGDGKSFKARLSVEATPDQLIAFGDAVDDPIERKDAEALSDLALTVAMSADKPLKDVESFKKGKAPGAGSLADYQDVDLVYSLGSKSGSQTYAEVRLVDAKLYLKVDLKGLARVTGEDPAQFSALSDELPAEAKALKDVFDGKWVSVDGKLLDKTLQEKAGEGAPGAPSAQPTLDQKAADNLVNTVKGVLTKNLTFEDKGKHDGADHIVVSAPARALVDGMLKGIAPIAKDIPQLSPLPTEVPADVPDRKLSVDLYLKKGAVSSLTFDAAQFAEKAGPDVRFPLTLGFSADATPVQAPSGATVVTEGDLDTIGELMAPAYDPDFDPDLDPGFDPGLDPELDLGGEPKPAPPLTEAQLKELEAAGMGRDEAKVMNSIGATFEELKAIAGS